MSANVEKLRELKQDLESLSNRHPEILGKEPSIQKPLNQAVSAARERWGQVSSDQAPATTAPAPSLQAKPASRYMVHHEPDSLSIILRKTVLLCKAGRN